MPEERPDTLRDGDEHDGMARIVAAAVWRPQPCMSGNIRDRLMPHEWRKAQDAAAAIIEVIIPELKKRAEARENLMLEWLESDEAACCISNHHSDEAGRVLAAKLRNKLSVKA